jgi:hypothetical protein
VVVLYGAVYAVAFSMALTSAGRFLHSAGSADEGASQALQPPLMVILRRKPKNPESPWVIIPVDPQGFGILLKGSHRLPPVFLLEIRGWRRWREKSVLPAYRDAVR